MIFIRASTMEMEGGDLNARPAIGTHRGGELRKSMRAVRVICTMSTDIRGQEDGRISGVVDIRKERG